MIRDVGARFGQRGVQFESPQAVEPAIGFRFIGRQASIYAMLVTRVIPDIALVVPFFLFIRKLGLLDHVGSLIITYLAITIPFSVFILVSYFESLPDELDKAARVDGCSRLQALLRVFLPLALPSLVAMILFAFLTSWNEFLLALTLTSSTAARTVPVGIALFAGENSRMRIQPSPPFAPSNHTSKIGPYFVRSSRSWPRKNSLK